MIDRLVAPDRIWAHSEHVAWLEVDGRVLVLRMDATGDEALPLVLDGTAADIWSVIGDGRSTAQIVDDLAAEFGLSRDSIAADVSAFLVALRELGLTASSDRDLFA
jgi:hypothetical protein